MTQLIGLGGQKNANFTFWDTDQQYRTDDMVVYNNLIYSANQNIAAGTAWNPAQWSFTVGSGGGNPTGNDIGVFYSTQTQDNLLPANAMTADVTQISSNVSIVSGSRITFANSGNRYNIQFSAQLDKTDSGQDNVEIWLSKNGVDEPWSNTSVDVDNNNGKVVAAWNFVIEPSAGDYYEIMWYSSDVDLRIYAQPAATRPAIPSLILTVTQC